MTAAAEPPALDRRIAALEDRLFHRFAVPAVTRLLRVGPGQVPVRVHDVGSGPPVLLLHPAAFFAASWMPVLPHLRGVRVLAVDQPGHGLSGGVDYSRVEPRAFTVQWLTDLLDALELPRAAVVGNSLGGLCGLWFAADAPARVTRLMVVGVPAVALRGVRADLGLALLGTPRVNRMVGALPLPRFVATRFLERRLGARAAAALPPEALEIYRLGVRRPEWRMTLPSLMERLLRGREPRPEMLLTGRDLRAVAAPTLFLWGGADAYGGPGMAHRAAVQMQEAEVVVWDRAGHMPQLDEPAGFARVVGEFVGARTARRGVPA